MKPPKPPTLGNLVRKGRQFYKQHPEFITIRLANGEMTDIPSAWITGAFPPGTYKISRRRVKFIDPTTDEGAAQFAEACKEADVLDEYWSMLNRVMPRLDLSGEDHPTTCP